MSVVRAFIAISLSPEIQARLHQVSTDLQDRLPGVPVRWVPSENIHLTLKFLGDVSVKNIDLLTKMIQAETSEHPDFEISVGELGAFPNKRRPRVLWVRVQAPPDLQSLHESIERATTRLGYAREERPFSPHLTLGRVSRNAKPDEVRQLSLVLQQTRVGFLGAARVKAVHLYQSELKPGGAIYTRLFSGELKARS
jgi:2'-5' RNA ligase